MDWTCYRTYRTGNPDQGRYELQFRQNKKHRRNGYLQCCFLICGRNSDSLVQLGYGRTQKRIEAIITDNTSSISVDLASDKLRTKALLKAASIPVPDGFVIKDKSELKGIIAKSGIPLVIKPNNGNQGKGVTLFLI